MSRILIADCHGLYRRGLRAAIENAIPESEVLEADCCQNMWQHCEPDGSLALVLVDLGSSSTTTLDILRAARSRYPNTRFAALAALDDRASIISSLEAGLCGFISKSQPDDEIIAAISDILSGRVYVPPSITRIDEPKAPNGSAHRRASLQPPQAEVRLEYLTRRQRQILPLLASGMSNKEIARALKIAEGTTKIHASSVLRVLGVRNRTEAAAVATNWLTPARPASSA
jgi:DNA-binding NarL/FixJ family response regulator